MLFPSVDDCGGTITMAMTTCTDGPRVLRCYFCFLNSSIHHTGSTVYLPDQLRLVAPPSVLRMRACVRTYIVTVHDITFSTYLYYTPMERWHCCPASQKQPPTVSLVARSEEVSHFSIPSTVQGHVLLYFLFTVLQDHFLFSHITGFAFPNVVYPLNY